MEELGLRPSVSIVNMVGSVFQRLGMTDKNEKLKKKIPTTKMGLPIHQRESVLGFKRSLPMNLMVLTVLQEGMTRLPMTMKSMSSKMLQMRMRGLPVM